MTDQQARKAARARKQARKLAGRSASTSRVNSDNYLGAPIEALMGHGDRGKRKRTAQPAQPAGDDSGRLSGWSQPATLPFSLSVTTSDRRWDMSRNGATR